MTKFAIVRIRGPVRVEKKIAHALKLLGLNSPNMCTLREENPSLLGTLQKVQPFVTWGAANDETVKLFGDKKTISLCPPRGGYGRKGVKNPFRKGGAYGKREDKINDLIKRMSHGVS